MRNRELKDSAIPWIGDIPKDWTVCFIKQIMRNKSIKGYPDEMVLSLYRDYGVVPKDSRDDNHNVTSEDTSSYKFVEVGDFVINKMKAWQGSMAVSDYQGIISPAYYICRFITNEIDRKYIHYLLRNDTYKAEYMRLSSGMRVGQWDLNIDDFLRIKMVLPSLSEQQKIANCLDRNCTEIDEMIALQEKIVEELKAYKQSVITEAVTKGLNPDVPMKDSGIEGIGEIPEHWRITTIGRLFRVSAGGDAKWDIYSDKQDSEHPFPVYTNTLDKNQTYAYTSIPVYKGDTITVTGRGDIGRAFYRKTPFDAIIRLLVLEKRYSLDCRYFAYFINNVIHFFTNSAAIGQLSAVQVVPYNLCHPSIEEQTDIADYLDTKCTEIDNLISIKLSKIDSLKEYKKSIIYEYVTGKKEVI